VVESLGADGRLEMMDGLDAGIGIYIVYANAFSALVMPAPVSDMARFFSSTE